MELAACSSISPRVAPSLHNKPAEGRKALLSSDNSSSMGCPLFEYRRAATAAAAVPLQIESEDTLGEISDNSLQPKL